MRLPALRLEELQAILPCQFSASEAKIVIAVIYLMNHLLRVTASCYLIRIRSRFITVDVHDVIFIYLFDYFGWVFTLTKNNYFLILTTIVKVKGMIHTYIHIHAHRHTRT